MALGVCEALLAVFISALIILATRVLPFALFRKKDPPSFVRFIEKYAPSLIMAILFIYCLKDLNFSSFSLSLPTLISVAVCAILQIFFRNSMVSVFGSTILYMILLRLSAVL